MLIITTKMTSVIRLNAPVRLSRTVKNRVDMPIMTASVPITENRSFHMLMDFSSEESSEEK